MQMHRSPSPEARHENVEHGVAVVQGYLKAQFPEHIIEVLKKNRDDAARRVRTFSVRSNGQRYVLRVADEVLDPHPGAPSVSDRLRQCQAARTLREAGAGNAIVVTANEVRAEKL
jgi:aminoglycoside phosphotransferase (APT) family kinase protein